ncbi:hypothetical protein CCY99_02930 [Helicobacter sp. 16-1353]|uniref:agmatine deiminase family protein n=1 Tax=Helicobacter sp. 16-1353 TaxID=2004996 RepID=UPI000DCCE447|nr:agmatine deiminase family protein [Helicobacter sp. 16-1353]RAX54730.1 hypothetical protein CCY99_02930 [Helicobacter sp. 16-1353]
MNKKLRFPAEWETQSGTIVAMPHKDSHWNAYLKQSQNKILEIITHIARFQPVIVVYKYAKDVALLQNKANIHLININTNDTWCRDFAPISLIKNNKIIMFDFIFNAWGLKFAANLDNAFSKKLYKSGILKYISKNISLKSKHFILEGGSIDTNGKGVLLTTTQCLLESNRNNISKNKIEKKLKKYFNAKLILWLENGFLSGDDTDCHIDNLARFVDSNTIIYLKCNNRFDKHYKALNAMEKELATFRALNGKAFNLIPLPMPKAVYYKKARLPAGYINFLFINNAILLPIFNDKNDEIAINTFKNLFPHREIIPIDSRILLRQGGSIHCLSMNIPSI